MAQLASKLASPLGAGATGTTVDLTAVAGTGAVEALAATAAVELTLGEASGSGDVDALVIGIRARKTISAISGTGAVASLSVAIPVEVSLSPIEGVAGLGTLEMTSAGRPTLAPLQLNVSMASLIAHAVEAAPSFNETTTTTIGSSTVGGGSALIFAQKLPNIGVADNPLAPPLVLGIYPNRPYANGKMYIEIRALHSHGAYFASVGDMIVYELEWIGNNRLRGWIDVRPNIPRGRYDVTIITPVGSSTLRQAFWVGELVPLTITNLVPVVGYGATARLSAQSTSQAAVTLTPITGSGSVPAEGDFPVVGRTFLGTMDTGTYLSASSVGGGGVTTFSSRGSPGITWSVVGSTDGGITMYVQVATSDGSTGVMGQSMAVSTGTRFGPPFENYKTSGTVNGVSGVWTGMSVPTPCPGNPGFAYNCVDGYLGESDPGVTPADFTTLCEPGDIAIITLYDTPFTVTVISRDATSFTVATTPELAALGQTWLPVTAGQVQFYRESP